MLNTGVAILNHDNPLLTTTAASRWSGQAITYGLEGGDIQGIIKDASTVEVGGTCLPLPLLGRHNALNYLGAIAVAQVLNLDWQALADGLTVDLPQGRARRITLPEDILILDETYNAGLESMLAALRLLADTSGTRRIAVLGTMKELGDRSEEFHRQVGETANKLGLDHLLILADPAEAEAMATGAKPLIAERFEGYDSLTARLRSLIQPGDRLLFKASRAVGLEKVVQALCGALA
jgi:UDP-N-acetylmuramoyl-tripeptide--D-alanyl-D-alanine ligase